MPLIKLTNDKPPISPEELDRLLATDISATKVSDTKENEFSDTKISATKYMNDYKREHYDTLRIDMPKGQKDLLKQEAEKRNISVTKLIRDAIEYYLGNK